MKEDHNKIQLYFSLAGIFVGAIGFLLHRFSHKLVNSLLIIITALFIGVISVIIFLEAEILLYDLCVDYPESLKGECFDYKNLFVCLLPYDIAELLLTLAALLYSIKPLGLLNFSEIPDIANRSVMAYDTLDETLEEDSKSFAKASSVNEV